MEKEERGNKKKVSYEDNRKITEQYLQGKTVEDVLAMEAFFIYPKEIIERIYEEKRWLIDAIGLVPYETICERYGLEKNTPKKLCGRYQMNGKTIAEIREEKRKQVEERLQAGESVDSIAADRSLFVEKSVIRGIDTKERGKKKTIASQDKKKITEQYLLGKTVEDVLAMEEFLEYTQETIEQYYEKRRWMIDAIRLVSYDVIYQRYGMEESSSRRTCDRYDINGKTITEIRAEKRKQIEERFQAGETVDRIAADAELFVEKSAVEEIDRKISRKPDQIQDLFLQGKTVEEVLEMNEFHILGKEVLEQIYQEKQWLMDAIHLVPYETICARYEMKKETLQSYCYRYTVSGKRITEIRAEKRKQVEERLQAGESVESIVADAELSVEGSAVQKIQKEREEKEGKRRISRDDKRKVQEQYLQGKTVEEVLEMDEFHIFGREVLEQIYQEKQWLIDAVRLVPYETICIRYHRNMGTLQTDCRRYMVGGKRVTEVRSEKSKQIEGRLQAGESVDSIAADAELFVEKSAVQKIEMKTKKKPEQVQEQFLQGKTIEEVLEMDEFRMCEREMLEKLYEEKRWLIDAVRLVPYETICARYEMKAETLQAYCYRYTVGGKRITEIRAEKRKQIEERLQAGESVNSIAADAEFFVEKSAVQNIQDKREDKERKRRIPCEAKKKVQKQYLQEKTIEKGVEREESCICERKMQEPIYQEKQWVTDAIRLVPYDIICIRHHRNMETLQKDCRQYTVNGKRITEIRTEKRMKIEERLQAGESIDSIAADRSLFVEKSAVQEIQRKMLMKETEMEVATSKKENPNEGKKDNLTKSTKEKGEMLDPEVDQAYNRICLMREKFNNRCSNPVEEKSIQTEEEKRQIETMLTRIEKQVAEAEEETDHQARKRVMKDIYQRAKEFADVTVTAEQARRLYDALHSVGMKKYMQTCKLEEHTYLIRIQDMSERKILVAMENAIEQIQDIGQLEKFRMQLSEMKTKRALGKDRLMGIIYRKITKLKEEQRSNHLRNDGVSVEVEKIIEGVTKGEIDIGKAQEVMDRLADRMIAPNQSHNQFALGKEQRIKQIQMQIRNAISQQAERFPVRKPEKTLELLRGIGMQEEMQNLGAVIENTIERKQFVLAHKICIDYGKKVRDGIIVCNLQQMRKKIQRAEIADLVLRAITSEIDAEKAVQFWKILEEGINLGNVNLRQVILGKTKDGMSISLADIWVDGDREVKQKE